MSPTMTPRLPHSSNVDDEYLLMKNARPGHDARLLSVAGVSRARLGNVFLCFTVLLLMAGCSSVPPGTGPGAEPLAAGGSASPAETLAARDALHAQHSEWAGTPYRLGGTNKAGVDCSAFVRSTFAHRFGLELPRTTEGQVRVGYPVDRRNLSAGDLVFFRTGYSKLHVGIYVDSGRFLHASSSRGVMMSHLDNPYWQKNYWHARRMDHSYQDLVSRE